METALIVSYTESLNENLTNILKNISCKKITTVKTCGEARRLSNEKDFDLYIINSPVNNVSGEDLAIDLVQNDVSQVIFLVKNDIYDYTSNVLENYGIITVPKPINKNMFILSLKLSKATFSRMKNMQKKATKLSQKLDDIRIVTRAKCLLISHLNMNEEQAHKHIEKKAMDLRKSKREVAENILKVYEN